MIEFVEKWNFTSDVLPSALEALRIELSNSNHVIPDGEDIDAAEIKPCIVGQEKSGIMLVTWVYLIQAEKPKFKTYVSLYDPSTHKCKIVFTHNTKLEIVTATVNSDHSLLAFSSVERKDSPGYVSPGERGDIYTSYLVEIKPLNRTFSLDVEWRTFQRVQFLDSPENHKISHLLFFHHKEWIGMYHMPMALVSDNSYMMSMLPTLDKVVRQFAWCQFDVVTQRLYYLVLCPQDEEEIDAKPLFSVVQFRGNGQMEYLLNFPLPLPMSMDLMMQQSLYFPNYLSSRVSGISLNMEVILSSKGSFYLCYQHPGSSNKYDSTSEDSSRDSTPEVSGSTASVTYSICCLHAGFTAKCVNAIEAVAGGQYDNPRISFLPFNDYLVVFLPGEFLHLLDLSSEHAPVHNILIRSPKMLPRIPDWNSSTHGRPLLSHCVREGHLRSSLLLLENKTQKAYKMQLNIRSILNLFVNSTASTRLAVLHASIVHLKESKIYRKIIERICQDPANVETADLLKEYLVACPYFHLKKYVSSAADLKSFPFSIQETLRGQVERDDEGNRVVYLCYRPFTEELRDVISKMLSRCSEEFWTELRMNLCLAHDPSVATFPLKILMLASVDVKSNWGQGFFGRVSQLVRGSGKQGAGETSRRNSTSSLPINIESTEKSYAEKERLQDVYRNNITVEKLVRHITSTQGAESKAKASKMSREYAEIRIKVMRSLWKSVLKSLQFNSEDEIIFADLSEPVTQNEAALFQVVERLKSNCDNLCYPGFPNMNKIFCLLAFRYLSRYQFMQYVEAQVLDITVDMVKRVLLEIPDEPDDVSLKVQLVSFIPKDDGMMALKLWNHPCGNRFLAQHMVSKLTLEATVLPTGNTYLVPENREEFVPLNTLVESVKLSGKQVRRSWGRPASGLTYDDLKFISATALTETDAIRNNSMRENDTG